MNSKLAIGIGVLASLFLQGQAQSQDITTYLSTEKQNSSSLVLSNEELATMQHFHKIGKDTTFNNSWYRKAFPDEIANWENIYTNDSTLTVEYDKLRLATTNISPTRFAFDSLKQEDGSFKKVFSPSKQNDLDKLVLDSIHIAKTGNHMSEKSSERLYGMRFGRLERLEQALTRMKPFLGHYISRLEEENIPLSALTIPIVESEFDHNAISKASAVGQFQFIPGTAKHYGLDFSRQKKGRDRVFDFRRHPIEAFEAFVDYYNDARRVLGEDNPLFIIISYNVGFNSNSFENVHSKEAEIARTKEKSFIFRSYPIQVMALTNIIKNMDYYFPDFDYGFDPIRINVVDETIRLNDVPEVYGLSQEDFISYNPQYHEIFTGPIKEGREIILPGAPSITKLKPLYTPQKFEREVKLVLHK